MNTFSWHHLFIVATLFSATWITGKPRWLVIKVEVFFSTHNEYKLCQEAEVAPHVNDWHETIKFVLITREKKKDINFNK